MALDYERFMLKQAEWRGEVTAKLEAINNDIVEIKSDVKLIRKYNRDRDIRIARNAGIISLIVAIMFFALEHVVAS